MRIRDSQNNPLDFCRFCRPSEWKATQEHSDPTKGGPDGRGDCFVYDDQHPDYESDEYRCEVCKWPLTKED